MMENPVNKTGIKNKQYKIGDIVAAYIPIRERAVSCKAIDRGCGETKTGVIVKFKDEDVLWVLGANGLWPNFVFRAFRGNCDNKGHGQKQLRGRKKTDGYGENIVTCNKGIDISKIF